MQRPAGLGAVRVLVRLIALAAAALGVAATTGLLSLYPSLTLLLGALLLVAVLARFNPAAGFLVAIGLVGLEGTIKIRLTVENVSHPLSIAAGALDLALLIALAGLALRSGPRRLLEIWRGAGRLERTGYVLIGLWLLLSVIQVPVGGHLKTAVEGFRLTQGYVIVGLLGGALLWSIGSRERLVTGALIGLAVISGYAALRVAIGPSGSERAFAIAPGIPQQVGAAFRAVGSFSGSFGLTSYLVPATVFAFAIALTSRRRRLLCAAVCGLGVVALVGSLVRAGLVATAVGLVVVAGLLVLDRRLGRRLKLAVAVSLVAVLIAGAGAVVVSSRHSAGVSTRASGLVSPGSDISVNERLTTWKRILKQVGHQPLGSGLGTVGRATGGGGGTYGGNAAGLATGRVGKAVYTDNSFLKILREQGIEGLALFLGGILALLGVLAVKLSRAGPINHPVAVGAVGAVCAFLMLFMVGEYIEQPGKILVWTLLGVALCDVHLRPAVAAAPRRRRGWRLAPLVARWRGASIAARVGTIAAAIVLTVPPTVLAATRHGDYTARVKVLRMTDLPSKPVFETVFPFRSTGTYVSRELGTEATRIGIAYAVDYLVAAEQLHAPFRVVEAPGPRAVVTAHAQTPGRARELAKIAGLQLVAASSREVDDVATAKLHSVEARLARSTPAERARLQRLLPFVRQTAAVPPSRIYPATNPKMPTVSGIDATVNRLPGPFPPRPNPPFVFVAGLALSAGLGWGMLSLSGRRAGRSFVPPPAPAPVAAPPPPPPAAPVAAPKPAPPPARPTRPAAEAQPEPESSKVLVVAGVVAVGTIAVAIARRALGRT